MDASLPAQNLKSLGKCKLLLASVIYLSKKKMIGLICILHMQANDGVSVRYHHVGIPYHYLCEPLLKRLGFYQVSQMVGMSVDRFLIGALVERWRPETNTFHLPVGEMTVSLQDVSCLWGLPIQGEPIIGKSEGPWVDEIETLLGVTPGKQVMKQKKAKGRR